MVRQECINIILGYFVDIKIYFENEPQMLVGVRLAGALNNGVDYMG